MESTDFGQLFYGADPRVTILPVSNSCFRREFGSMNHVSLFSDIATGLYHFLLGQEGKRSWGSCNGRISTSFNHLRNHFERGRSTKRMDYWLPDFYLGSCMAGLRKPQRARPEVA